MKKTMATYNRMTRQDAEAAGFTVDRTCYPWFGYTGPRFNPTQSVEVYTDLESEMLRQQKPEEADYDDLLLAELKSDASRLGMMRTRDSWDSIWLAYGRLASKIRNAVDKTFMLYGYLRQEKNNDPDPAKLDVGQSPSVTIRYRRTFGKAGGMQFFAEARIAVTTDAVEFITEVCPEEQTVAYDQKSSRQEICAKDTDTLLALVRAGLTVSLEQVAHVAHQESIPTVFGLPD